MYAVVVEVNADETRNEVARGYLNQEVAPRVRDHGAKAGYWLASQGGRGISVVVFETEDEAQQMATLLQVGQPPQEGAPEGVTVRSVEVRKVLASV